MIISYPYLPERSSAESEQDYEKRVLDFLQGHGIYPVSHDMRWHGGIHLYAQEVAPLPVRAIPARAVVTLNRANRGSGSVTAENPRNLKSVGFIQPFYTGFICYDQTDGTVTRGWAKRIPSGEKWQLNLDDEEAKQLAGAVHLYQVQAVNRSGWAVTVDDVTGDENVRRRMLRYCLINPPKALCGEGEVGYLKDGPKADLTEYALRILRSIEFLDDEPAKPEAAPPSPTQRESLLRPNE